MTRARSTTLVTAVVLAIQAVSVHAHADDEKRRCVTAYEEGQRLRQTGKLLAARDQLRVCSADACPGIVASDCTLWLRDVQAAIPSIVVSARTSDGTDITDARLRIDGTVAQVHLTGFPIEVDPGEHTIRCEAPHSREAERRVLVIAGEKNRVVPFTIEPAPVSQPPSPSPDKPARAPFVAYPLAAGGALALTAGVVLDVLAYNRLDELRSTCAPFCDSSDGSATRTQMVIGDVLAGVGVVALGVAVWMFVRTPPARAAAKNEPF